MNEINNYNTSTNIINCYLYSITNQEMYKALVMCSVIMKALQVIHACCLDLEYKTTSI